MQQTATYRPGPDAGRRPSVLVYSGCDIIGDGLNKLPAVGALRRAFPAHHITWLAGKGPSVYGGALLPLVEGLLDEVIEDAGIGLRYSELLSRPLAGRFFDIIIDTQQNVKTTLILRRLPHRLFVTWAARGLLSDRRPPRGQRERPESVLQRILQLISLASGTEAQPVHALRIPSFVRAAAATLLPPGPVYIGIAPGAGGKVKCWPLDRFIALARHQAQAGRVPVFFIGPGEREWVGRLREAVPEALFPELAAQAPVTPGPILTIAIAERLHAAVSNDSGTGHMLCAGGRPLVTLFGPSNADKFTSPTLPRAVIRAQEYGGEEIELIPLDAVIAAVERVLAGAATAGGSGAG